MCVSVCVSVCRDGLIGAKRPRVEYKRRDLNMELFAVSMRNRLALRKG